MAVSWDHLAPGFEYLTRRGLSVQALQLAGGLGGGACGFLSKDSRNRPMETPSSAMETGHLDLFMGVRRLESCYRG